MSRHPPLIPTLHYFGGGIDLHPTMYSGGWVGGWDINNHPQCLIYSSAGQGLTCILPCTVEESLRCEQVLTLSSQTELHYPLQYFRKLDKRERKKKALNIFWVFTSMWNIACFCRLILGKVCLDVAGKWRKVWERAVCRVLGYNISVFSECAKHS